MLRDLISVDEALQKLLHTIEPLPSETIVLTDAVDRVLAEDVIAKDDIPPFSNSSMDGYAIHSSDVIEASENAPVRLEVTGDISAGEHDLGTLVSGQAMRIMTGAPLPRGADAVVPVEFTSDPEAMAEKALKGEVFIKSAVREGDYIRQAGQDVRVGTRVLSSGHRLRAQDIGILAAIGIAKPEVHQLPKVALVSTGDELISAENKLRPGLIRDSNGYSLGAAVHVSGAIPIRMGIAPDDSEVVASLLYKSVESGADLIVTSAGVSMGAYDFVRSVVQSSGYLEFWRVNIRPGKPLLFGSFEGVPILGLPGNPVSALVTFEIFVRPTIERLSGIDKTERFTLIARLAHDIKSDGRESYLRASLSRRSYGYEAELVGSQDSGVLSSLVEANALIIIPAGVKKLAAGDKVETWVLRQGGVL
jgi:molybdopterin molybdotransferase